MSATTLVGRSSSGVEIRCEKVRLPIAPVQPVVNQLPGRIEIDGTVVVFDANLGDAAPSVQRPLNLALPSQVTLVLHLAFGGWMAEQGVSPFILLLDQMGRAFANLNLPLLLALHETGS